MYILSKFFKAVQGICTTVESCVMCICELCCSLKCCPRQFSVFYPSIFFWEIKADYFVKSYNHYNVLLDTRNRSSRRTTVSARKMGCAFPTVVGVWGQRLVGRDPGISLSRFWNPPGAFLVRRTSGSA